MPDFAAMRWRRGRTPEIEDVSLDAPNRCRVFDERLRAIAWTDGTISAWLKRQREVEPCIAAGLRASWGARDVDGVERYLLAAALHPSRDYTATLCELLDARPEDISSDAIVDAFEPTADPAAVPALRRALTWVPEGDDYGQIGRKVVWALERIGTPEAYTAIREDVTDDLPIKVVEAARDALSP